MKNSHHRRRAKTVLRLPDLEHAKSAVLNSLASPESRRSYEFAIQNFVQWYCSEPRLALNRIVVTRYRMQLEQLHLARMVKILNRSPQGKIGGRHEEQEVGAAAGVRDGLGEPGASAAE